MGWWRSFVRRKTKPIHPERAKRMRNLLSGLYFFFAWNALAYGIYTILQNKIRPRNEEKQTPSYYYAKILGTPDAKVYRFKGLQLADEYEITGTLRRDHRSRREENEREDREKKEEKEKASNEDLKLLIEETSSL